MNILFAVDENFILPLYTLINSIVINNNVKFNFYLLYSDIQKKSLSELKEYIENKGSKLIPIFIENRMFDNVYLPDRITKTSFYRLLICNLLPNNIDRILYLDADIVINSCLKDIYNIEFEDKYLCVIPDKQSYQFNNKKHRKRLNLNSNHKYFNTGVILFNIEYMREKININEYISFLNDKVNENLLFGDQDILNIFFQDRVKYLPEIYNYKPRLFKQLKLKKPKIIHYYGNFKP